MTRSAWLAGTLAALATGGTGYWAGQHGDAVPALVERARTEFAHWMPDRRAAPVPATPEATGPIVYYRHPDGLPDYAAEPKRTPDGREYRAVRASEDVRFDDDAAVAGSAQAPAVAAGGARRVRFYRNPMGLPDTSPVPKKDSMGMEYLPVYEDEAGDESTVRIPPGKVQRTGVRSETVERRVVSRPVRVPGTLQPDERRITVVSTRSDAFVDRVENVTVGDVVRRGQPLVEVYSPEINAAAAQLIANPGFDGSRRRLENLNVPAEAIAEMERTRKVPAAIMWSSPRDGVVLERGAIEGMKAPAGMVLFRIADLSRMWLLADVPEHDLGGVRVGQAVTVRARALPGRTFAGKVDVIYPQLNRETRTARVRVALANPDSVLLADMYADVEIATGRPEPVVAVPDDAVIDTGDRQVVLLDKGEGRFEPRPVKLGVRGGGHVEIRDGVEAGERVVTSANFLIDAESNLKAALQGLSAAPPTGPQAAVEGAPR
ncbi:efflux RND transporter periplasmic adaptor subunit [Methylobacterium iners]|uniref:Multidrug resistance protein MdtA n=1 Tax=Methylobacterium iners TaxID=418707 RepID=A0ABQ4RUV5_9HYPH|nr:efflux RND transporter periplasmic adaptor subunit [Methylobacterium iners]GJD94494.1 Multidrug resistance protein MdtA [Methylobacterium iners]